MVTVLDANVLVSAFLAPKGEDATVLRQAREHDFYLSPFILSEVYAALHYPRIRQRYDYTESEIDQHIITLTQASTVLDPLMVLDVCPDPKDNAVLACASTAKAAYLVTRNLKHFPKEYEGVKVIHPRNFWPLMSPNNRPTLCPEAYNTALPLPPHFDSESIRNKN